MNEIIIIRSAVCLFGFEIDSGDWYLAVEFVCECLSLFFSILPHHRYIISKEDFLIIYLPFCTLSFHFVCVCVRETMWWLKLISQHNWNSIMLNVQTFNRTIPLVALQNVQLSKNKNGILHINIIALSDHGNLTTTVATANNNNNIRNIQIIFVIIFYFPTALFHFFIYFSLTLSLYYSLQSLNCLNW